MSPSESAENAAPEYKCPGCGTKLKWSSDSPHRPFCSERCKNGDFVSWANGEHHIPGNPTYEDLLSGELSDDPTDY